MCARIPISLDTCKGLCPPFHHTSTLLQSCKSNKPTNILTDPHLHILPHSCSLTRRCAILLRLIISQVWHSVVIWASEVLTSISASCSFLFSTLPSASLFILSTLFHVHSLTLFLSPSVFLLCCIAEAGVLQLVFSVRSNEKLPETRG